MSSHGTKARARHPDPVSFTREQFWVAHVMFELIDHPENGITFALIAGLATEAKYRRPLFSGHIERGMGTQLRRLAHRLDELEARLPRDPQEGDMG